MGLDMFAYTAAKPDTKWDEHREIAYWRKHPNLQGWMEKLWLKKGTIPLDESDQFIEDKYPGRDFNGVEVELTWEDIDDLERAVTYNKLPPTRGFFFGEDSDEHYKEKDLEFIRNARAELFMGLKVFYNSSW